MLRGINREADLLFALVFRAIFALFRDNTRAVPLVRKENAHKGRVFFCLHSEHDQKGSLQ